MRNIVRHKNAKIKFVCVIRAICLPGPQDFVNKHTRTWIQVYVFVCICLCEHNGTCSRSNSVFFGWSRSSDSATCNFLNQIGTVHIIQNMKDIEKRMRYDYALGKQYSNR